MRSFASSVARSVLDGSLVITLDPMEAVTLLSSSDTCSPNYRRRRPRPRTCYYWLAPEEKDMQPDVLIDKLKTRLVFRVAVGYGVVTFALLQVAEPIMHALHLPDAVLTWLVLALAAGFPTALTIAGVADYRKRLGPLPQRTRSLQRPALGFGRARTQLLTVGVTGALVAALAVMLFLRREARVHAARQLLPQIADLVERGRYADGFRLAEQAEQVIPEDPQLLKLWPELSREIRIETTPPGADVFIEEYNASDQNWRHLGRSPIQRIRLPLAFFRFKLIKDGFAPVEAASSGLGKFALAWSGAPVRISSGTIHRVLDEASAIPAGMVRVQGGTIELELPGLEGTPPVELPDYFIDRTEVTNAQFKRFVEAGGYGKEEFWKEPFLEDRRAIPFREAMVRFRDRTGRSGPATWELGEYPEGQKEMPVTGVSWYEAAAFANFVGKSLPNVFQWSQAAGTWATSYISPASNFSGTALSRVGSFRGLGPYGTYDMAGNAKEWCWNATGNKRLILGGAFNEPTYMFNDPDAQSPFDRKPTHGFRLAQSIHQEQVPKAATDPLSERMRDFAREKPVSDEVFEAFRSLYRYDKASLDARVEAVDDSSERWRKEKVSYAAAYGNERVSAYIFTPRRGAPPYQTLVIFPGSGGIDLRSSEVLPSLRMVTFVVKSGRAVIYPVYKSTFERGDDLHSDIETPTAFYRDHVVQWSKDLGRTLDYLESRKDLDSQKVALYGLSWGAKLGPLLAAVETRIKVGILVGGGLPLQRALPEADPFNFASRARQPMLMVNGRYDYFFPFDSTQLPLFSLLGASAKDKRHVVFEAGHVPPNELFSKEILD